MTQFFISKTINIVIYFLNILAMKLCIKGNMHEEFRVSEVRVKRLMSNFLHDNHSTHGPAHALKYCIVIEHGRALLTCCIFNPSCGFQCRCIPLAGYWPRC